MALTVQNFIARWKGSGGSEEANSLPQRPPFLLTCDIGHAFHLWEGFSGRYGGYGARPSFVLDDLLKPEVQSLLRAIGWTPKAWTRRASGRW